MKNILTLTALFLISLSSYAQVEIALQLMTPDLIGKVNLDQEPTIEWIGTINELVEKELSKEKGNHEAVVLITLFHDKEASFKVAAKPKLSSKTIEALKMKLSSSKSPKTKFSTYSFAIMAKINKGYDKEEAYYPEIKPQFDEEIGAFIQLDLKGKTQAIKDWAINEAFPLLAYYETNVDPQFEGVQNCGKMLDQKKYTSTTTRQLTDENMDYWRANMEMSGGNQLLPLTKLCIHLYNGELDKAKNMLFIIQYFSDKETLGYILEEKIEAMLSLYTQELTSEINKGIALHDAKKYDKAVTHYQALLKQAPNSAWLNYELFFSQAGDLSDMDNRKELWNNAKNKIYDSDPMYHMNVQANSGKEGYLMFRRQEVQNLFQTQDKFDADLINYADIALELENYSYAAQLYWLVLGYVAEEKHDDRNMIAHFLYCIDKLGDTYLKDNFKIDTKKAFKKIEQERKEAMESSMMYKAFSK